jgi:uncharacterized membrane protein YidH (DUF202 family)
MNDGGYGAQNERTALAWLRTSLGFGVCALLCSRLVAGTALAVGVVVLAGALAALALFAAAAGRYRRNAATLAAGGSVAAPVAALALSALTVALGVVAAVLIALGSG